MLQKVKIAIIDNGVNKRVLSECLKAEIFIDQDGICQKEKRDMGMQAFQHGTNCAFIVKKYCENCYISSIRILDDRGKGIISNIQPALEWCYNNNIQIVNLSLGTTNFQDKVSIRKVINHYAHKGIIFVAASANNDYMTYPASFSNVISVVVGETFDVGIDMQRHKGIDFTAPSEHQILIEKNSFWLEKSNSYAAPYVTAMIGNILMEKSCGNICWVREKLLSKTSGMSAFYYPDWIESAWVSERCERSAAEYYFTEVKGELETCISKIDTIVINDKEEFERYHIKKRHILYLGKEAVECSVGDKYFWSRDQRVAQIVGCKKRVADIDIPVIICKLDKKQDIIWLLRELKKYFGKDGYNVYAISNKIESVLYDLEFLPEELCDKPNKEQIHNFLYWQTYYSQTDVILLGVNTDDSLGMKILENVGDMVIEINSVGEKVKNRIFCDGDLKEETFICCYSKEIGIIYQKILKCFMEDMDE